MTSRERMLAAIEFETPDRIPLFCCPSPAGFYVHGDKLRKLLTELEADNLFAFPEAKPERKHFNADGTYHEIATDAWGVEWEYLIYGVQGHPYRYPLKSWEEADRYSFPLIHTPGVSPEQCQRYLIFGGCGSIFERPSSLRPFDEVMMDFYLENPDLLRFTDRLVDYFMELNARALAGGCDVFCFGDDFGTQSNAIFPPDVFERVFVPRYREMFAPIQKARKKILFHCCGQITSLLEQILDLNIDILWPQLSLYGRDEKFLDRCAARHTALFLHPDRQYLIPRGTPAEIRSWVKDMAARYRHGGGIFYVEIENDAPWENVSSLLEAIAEYR